MEDLLFPALFLSDRVGGGGERTDGEKENNRTNVVEWVGID